MKITGIEARPLATALQERLRWGAMIASGRDTIVNAPWVAAAPGAFLVLVVVACTLIGDALRDALDPHKR